MWKGTDGVQADGAKYLEKMEEREFHSDKGVCAGTLLDRTTGIGAPSQQMSVSKEFLDMLATKGTDHALEPVEEKQKKPSKVVASEDPNMYTVAAEDPSATQAWEAERAARATQEEALAAKRKAKRDKKKANKRAKSGGATPGEDDEDEDD